MATVAVRARRPAVRSGAADVAASDRARRDVVEDAATATREVSVAGYKAVGDANMTMKYVSMRPAVGIRRARARVSTCACKSAHPSKKMHESSRKHTNTWSVPNPNVY